MEQIIIWFAMAFGVLPLVCEAITEIIGGSTLFRPVRNYIVRNEISFLKSLFECKYCLSVWVSAFVSLVGWKALGLPLLAGSMNLLFLFLLVFVVHRVSNVMHLGFDIISEYKQYRWTTPIEG